MGRAAHERAQQQQQLSLSPPKPMLAGRIGLQCMDALVYSKLCSYVQLQAVASSVWVAVGGKNRVKKTSKLLLST